MDLPQGWAQVALGDLGVWRGGATPSKSVAQFWRGGTLPWVSPKDMKRPVIEDAIDRLHESALGKPATKLVPAGSVLVVARSGILQHSLPVAVAAREVAINQDIKALVPRAGVHAAYVAAAIRAHAPAIIDVAVKAGTTVESLDFDRFKAYVIPLAPTNEQARIVAKLEPLLARCASVRAELARVAKLAARERRGALTAAFRGGLTRAPRAADGEPLGWRTVPLGTLFAERPANGISPPSSGNATGTLSLRLSATTAGVLRLTADTVKRVQLTPSPDSKYWLRRGDLLVQRANSLEHVGAAAIFEGEDRTYVYPDLMIRVRIRDELTRRYVWRFLNSPGARRYLQRHATGTAGNMPKITAAVLAALPVPLAPREQMPAILEAIDRVLARLDAVARENDRCARLVGRLERTFLVRAASGRLVKQDARDEPASSILTTPQMSPTRNSDGRRARGADGPRPPDAHVASTREYVERRLAVWPADGMTFEQLRADAPGTYEELKDVVFEFMASARLTQRYDARERTMKLVGAS